VSDNNAASLVTRIKMAPGNGKAFAEWHARMATAPGDFPGFISADVKAPKAPDIIEWSVVQHFRSLEEMQAWQKSELNRRLFSEAGAISGDGASSVSQSEAVEHRPDATVTEAVATFVKAGFEDAYRKWAAKTHAAEAQFPGYRGGSLQPPISDKQRCWTTLVHFATPEQLDNWLGSVERQKLLEEHEALVESWTARRLPTSFAGWFHSSESDREPSTTLKQSMLVLLVLFPIVMMELRFLSPLLTGAGPAIATFIGNVVSIGLIGWPFMPITVMFLNWWLSPKKSTGVPARVAGYFLLLALYGVEIAALWNLL
jgi:antibiotic biosynthesis monooxygenase (ABM) superfamily enzyme